MDNSSLNKILKDRAVDLGLCGQWQKQWSGNWDECKLIAKYKEGIDFCLANHYPSNDFIKQNFTLHSLRQGGIFVDDTYSATDMRTVVALGASELIVRYNGEHLGEVYITDNAKVSLTAKGSCHVIVHILGNANIIAHQYANASLLIIRHSNECSIITKGKVKVKDEVDWLEQ